MADKTNTSVGEKIYNFPLLYKLKIDILNKINNLDLNFDKLIKNKKVLDIGCGSYQTRYDINLPRLRVGIDPSKNAIEAANKLYPNCKHFVGSADNLPFNSKSFDVSLLLYVLHHIPKAKWPKVFKEAVRVTKDKIIIIDHVKNSNYFISALQMLYWGTIDGGDYYPNEHEWKKILKMYNIKSYRRLGKLFDHICYYEISLNK